MKNDATLGSCDIKRAPHQRTDTCRNFAVVQGADEPGRVTHPEGTERGFVRLCSGCPDGWCEGCAPIDEDPAPAVPQGAAATNVYDIPRAEQDALLDEMLAECDAQGAAAEPTREEDEAELRKLAEAIPAALKRSAVEWQINQKSQRYQDASDAVRNARWALEEACTPEAILALLDRLAALRQSLASAEAKLAEATGEPSADIFWLADDTEVGANDLEEFADQIDVGGVARINRAHFLSDMWIAHVRIPETETSDEDSEIQLFATEAAARAALSPSPSEPAR